MIDADADPIRSFYEAHPYPPPVDEPDAFARRAGSERAALVAHHRIWPARPSGSVRSVLVAGCGTSQAVRHALARPHATVVGIDVSAASIAHSRALAEQCGATNLQIVELAVERAGELGERFDHIICTGVLHHLASPERGLRALREVLAPGGALTLMVYAPYGRAGVYLMQDYCRRLGIGSSPAELHDLVATLRELPEAHPLRMVLRSSRDFADDDAVADALLNPRDRAFSVPELLDLLGGAGLRLGRWERQAPYLPDCGSVTETPHATAIATRQLVEQHALMELFRGTMVRHTAIAFADDDPLSGSIDFSSPEVAGARPLVEPTAVVVEERLPAGVSAAILNRAHTDRDLVLFADRAQHELFRAIDGRHTVGDLGPDAVGFVERLWRHDLVVLDATRSGEAA